mgnify:CR=1 FL=1
MEVNQYQEKILESFNSLSEGMEVEIVKNPFCKETRTTLSKKKLKKINIGKIPIMLGSKYCVLNKLNNSEECKYDLGGYFIINGNEKVIVCQEMIAHNLVFVFKSGKTSSKYSHIVDVKSTAPDGFYTPKNVSLKLTSRDVGSGKVIRAIIPHVRHEIPLFILFRALGLESDKEILKYIVHDLSNKDNKNDFIVSCGIYRTSRKIMDGNIYIPENLNDH